ncbi:MAG: ABC transporter substrate-binding protein [Clostridia bacterium]|nr:ABC transporter substrate-binding protein [Clostridia bacterium]MBQ3867571.1 ABC transporter substrate-binding protein [Clostridia bacterium]
MRRSVLSRMHILLTSLLLLAVLLTGCFNDYVQPRNSVVPEIPEKTPAPTPEAVSTGGTLTVAVQGSPRGFNPLTTVNEDLVYYSAFAYEPLIRLGSSMVPEGAIATDWSSPDGVSWTVYLRQDVKFSDGSQLTARDVAATVEALQNTESVYSECVAGIDTCTPEENSVKFRLRTADGLFPWKLFFPILKAGETGSAFPAGTGPFRLESAGGSELRYVRNENYRGKAAAIDAVELKFYETAAEKALSGCDLILLYGDAAVKYSSQLGYSMRQFDGNSLICIVPYMYTGKKTEYRVSDKQKITRYATKRPESLSINMRKVLECTLDRERVIERTVSGKGKAYDWPGLDNTVFRKHVEPAVFADNTVEKLLKLEGYTHEGGNTAWYKAADVDKKQPLTFNFIVDSTDVELIQACDSVVSRLKAIGIKSVVDVAVGGELTAKFLSGEYDYTFMRLNTSLAPDLRRVFANGSIFDYNGYDTETVRGKVNALTRTWQQQGTGTDSCIAFAESFSTGLAELYDALEKDLPFIGLYVRRSTLLYSARLGIEEAAGTEPWNVFPDPASWYMV